MAQLACSRQTTCAPEKTWQFSATPNHRPHAMFNHVNQTQTGSSTPTLGLEEATSINTLALGASIGATGQAKEFPMLPFSKH